MEELDDLYNPENFNYYEGIKNKNSFVIVHKKENIEYHLYYDALEDFMLPLQNPECKYKYYRVKDYIKKYEDEKKKKESFKKFSDECSKEGLFIASNYEYIRIKKEELFYGKFGEYESVIKDYYLKREN